jgi:hypothetical protein
VKIHQNTIWYISLILVYDVVLLLNCSKIEFHPINKTLLILSDLLVGRLFVYFSWVPSIHLTGPCFLTATSMV